MNLEQIDRLLADWKKKLEIVSQNLIDLHGLATYQRLTGTSGFPKAELKGITRSRVTPALEGMTELFGHFDLLLTTITKAAQLRKQVSPLWGSQQKLDEIEQILTGTSIQLAVVQIPLAQRGLLSESQSATAIAPDNLLAAMTSAFQVARDAVIAVDEAWNRLEPALIAANDEILSLQRLAASPGIDSLPELATARERIGWLRDRIETDPLGVSDDFDLEIQAPIARVKATLQQLAQQQTKVREGLAIAQQQLFKLNELHAKAQTAFAESQEKVVDLSSLKAPLTNEQIDAISQWLTRLETKYKEGLLNPVSVGLENWNAKVKEYIVAEERAIAANNAPLQLRRELRGRLDALKAKALARGLAEDRVLSELAENAKQLLYDRPTPLDKAAELVTLYEKRLNSNSGGQLPTL